MCWHKWLRPGFLQLTGKWPINNDLWWTCHAVIKWNILVPISCLWDPGFRLWEVLFLCKDHSFYLGSSCFLWAVSNDNFTLSQQRTISDRVSWAFLENILLGQEFSLESLGDSYRKCKNKYSEYWTFRIFKALQKCFLYKSVSHLFVYYLWNQLFFLLN